MLRWSAHTAMTLVCLGPALVSGGAVAAGTAPPQPPLGSPLAGLSQDELARFEAGRAWIDHDFTVVEGLGPIFNKARCSACHGAAMGGSDVIAVYVFSGKGDPGSIGGPLFQSMAISEACGELPPKASILSIRQTRGAIGAGLIEAIADAAIVGGADPADGDGDGISGRVAWVTPIERIAGQRPGRFGWKGRWASILSATASEGQQNVGISNLLIPFDEAPNGNQAQLAICDDVADPEDVIDRAGLGSIDRMTDFLRFLSPPPQTPRSGMTGEAIFQSIGCAQCHQGGWTTSESLALPEVVRGKALRPYSDFLLHDMGQLADGIAEGAASGNEFMTPPLWNLRARSTMLHDGRIVGGSFADRVALAIDAHGPFGEGAAAAEAFSSLSATSQEHLVAFLDSLGRREFDADGDGDVDLVDFASLQACFGVGSVTPDDACAVHDLNQDGSVDRADADGFVLVAEGLDGDCDGDGAADLIEILLGAEDANGDGVPDGCLKCPADIDGNGGVGSTDLAILLGGWGTPVADVDGDGVTGSIDLAILLGAWGPC